MRTPVKVGRDISAREEVRGYVKDTEAVAGLREA